MKILVCVKQVPDTTEVRIDPKTGTMVREGVPSILCIHCEEDGSHLRGTRDGEDLRLVYCGGARFLAVKPDAPDTVVCHLEFLIRAGRAWGVRVGTRVFERD